LLNEEKWNEARDGVSTGAPVLCVEKQFRTLKNKYVYCNRGAANQSELSLTDDTPKEAVADDIFKMLQAVEGQAGPLHGREYLQAPSLLLGRDRRLSCTMVDLKLV
jgi:hypothetical protein